MCVANCYFPGEISNSPHTGNDLLNATYGEIYDDRSAGLTGDWWTTTVDRLTKWSAYRGRRLPNTKAAITAGGLERLNEIAALYSNISAASSSAEPVISELHWESVAPLFTLASSIKPGSPVFPSKMCHFVFPKLFTVVDNRVTVIFEYEFYWRGMKEEWQSGEPFGFKSPLPGE